MIASVFFLLASGALVYVLWAFFLKEGTGLFEALFEAMAAMLVELCVTAATSAVFGVYSLYLVSTVTALCAIVAGVIIGRRGRLRAPLDGLKKRKFLPGELLTVLILTAVLVLYSLFPTAYYLGSRDPGIYLINAVSISETGRAKPPRDTYLAEHYDELKDVIQQDFPAIYSDYAYGYSDEIGEYSFQFPPMFPALLAVGYDVGGMGLLLRLDALLGVLSLVALFFAVRRFLPGAAAFPAVLLLALCPAQIWAARITQTEILAQFLFFLAAYLFAKQVKEGKATDGLICGLILGVGLLNRVDSLIFGVAVFVLMAYYAIFVPGRMKYGAGICAGYVISGGLSLTTVYWQNRWYIMENLLSGNQLVSILLMHVVLAAVAGLSVGIRILFLKKREPIFLVRFLTSRKGAMIVSILFFVFFLFAFYVRPTMTTDTVGGKDYFAANSTVQFCMYVSWAAIPLAILGVYAWLRKEWEAVERGLLFFLAGMASLIGYLYRPSIHGDHIWLSRRWITASIPFVLVFAGMGVLFLGQLLASFLKKKEHEQIRKRVATGAAECGLAALCVFFLWQSRVFLFSSMFSELPAAFDSVAADMEDDEVYFTDNQQIASTLRFVYGKNVYVVADKASQEFRKYILDKGSVLFIGQDFTTYQFDLASEILGRHRIEGTYLEETVAKYPEKTYIRINEAGIYRIHNLSESESRMRDIAPESFILINGMRDGSSILSDGREGFVFCGPYASVLSGTYTFQITLRAIDLPPDGRILLDVAAGKGAKIYGTREITKADFGEESVIEIEMTVTLEQTVTDLELRLNVNAGTYVALEKAGIRNVGRENNSATK